jgi:hypothetical protein
MGETTLNKKMRAFDGSCTHRCRILFTPITLRQGARVIEDSRRLRVV